MASLGLLLLTSCVLWLTSCSSGHATFMTEHLRFEVTPLGTNWTDCPRRRPKPDKRLVLGGAIHIENDCEQPVYYEKVRSLPSHCLGMIKKCFKEFDGLAGVDYTLSLWYDTEEVHNENVRLLEWDPMSLDVYSHDNGTLTLFSRLPGAERIFMAEQNDSHVHLLIMVNSSIRIIVDGKEAQLVQSHLNETMQGTPIYLKPPLRIGTSGKSSGFGGQIYMLDVFMRILNKKDAEGEMQYMMLQKNFLNTHYRLYHNYFTECICPYGSSFIGEDGCSDGSNRFGFMDNQTGQYFYPPDAVNNGGNIGNINNTGYWIATPGSPLYLTLDKHALLTSLSILVADQQRVAVSLVDFAGVEWKMFCIMENGSSCDSGVNKTINGTAQWIDTGSSYRNLSWHPEGKGIVAQKFLMLFKLSSADGEESTINKVLSVVLDGRYLDSNRRPGECFCFPGNSRTNKNGDYVCNECGSCQCINRRSYCQPYLTNVIPAYGPTSGGTTVRLEGGGLQPRPIKQRFKRMNVTVRIGENRCNVVFHADNVIICETEAMKGTMNSIVDKEQDISVSIQVGHVLYDVQQSLKYTYLPDPVISHIHPYKTIISGGLPLTFTGKHMTSFLSPVLTLTAVKQQKKSSKECSVHNSTMMICHVPWFKRRQILKRMKETPVLDADLGISALHISNIYKNLTDVLPCLKRFKIYMDPELHQRNLSTFRPYLGDEILEIRGKRLNDASQKEDYTIWLNREYENCKEMCPVVKLTREVIRCRPPQTLPCNITAAFIQVQVGYYTDDLSHPLMYDYSMPGNSTFEAGPTGVAGAIFSLMALASLSVFAYLYWKWRSRRKLTKEEELELLQYQCMDYQALIQRESDDPEDFLKLLSIDMREQLTGSLINEQELKILNEIGHGNFGKVYKGLLYRGEKQKVVAVKTLKQEAVNNRELEEFLEEATIMKDFHHPNVLSLLGVVFKKGRIYVLLPFMAKGDLKNYIAKKSYNIITFTTYASDVAKGMAYLAERKFIHRDLAARNCMVNATDQVIVADFGLARDIYEKDYYRLEDRQRPLPWKWMALECLLGQKFTVKSDVWSFGVLMWEIFTQGRKPYNEVRNEFLRDHLSHGHRLERPKNCPDILWDVMWRCWLLNVDARPSFANIVDDLEKVIEQYSGMKKGIDVDCRDTIASEPQEEEDPNKRILRQHNQNVWKDKGDRGQAQVDRYTLTPTNTILPKRHDINNSEELDAGYFDPIEPRFEENPTKETSRMSVTNDDADNEGYLVPSNPHGSQTENSDGLEKGGDTSLKVEIEPQYINQDGIMIQSEYLTPETIESVM